MKNWINTPAFWVSLGCALLYVIWAIFAFTWEAPLGVSRSIESISSLDELTALATLPIGLFSAIAVGLASWAVILQKRDQEETEKRFQKEIETTKKNQKATEKRFQKQIQMTMAAPIRDKCELVTSQIASTRKEVQKIRRCYVQEVAKLEHQANGKIRVNKNGIFDNLDLTNAESRFPHRFLSTLLYTDAHFDVETEELWPRLHVHNVTMILGEFKEMRQILDKLVRLKRKKKVLDHVLGKLDSFSQKVDKLEGGYLDQLKRDTPSSVKVSVRGVYARCHSITKKIDRLRVRIDHVCSLELDSLRGFDIQSYLGVIKASAHYSSVFSNNKRSEESYPENDTGGVSIVPGTRIWNYDSIQKSLDDTIIRIFEEIVKKYPEVTVNCHAELESALSAVFKPKQQHDMRDIIFTIQSPFISLKIAEEIKKSVSSGLKS